MTVPDGAPKHIEWVDRMAQAIIGASSDAGTIAAILGTLNRLDRGKEFDDAFRRLHGWIMELDAVRDEILNTKVFTADELLEAVREAFKD